MSAATSLSGRPWLRTAHGRAWCADEPEAYDYSIDEIAHALSHLNRFAGHTKVPYSVADHSLRVARLVQGTHAIPALCRAALLHDAAEAFCVDMPAPIKRLPALAGYRELIERVERAIALHFGLEEWLGHPAIYHADMVLLATEQRDLLVQSEGLHTWAKGLPDPLDVPISPLVPRAAATMFVEAWRRLGGNS